MKCRICGNIKNNKIYPVKEMMFGFKDNFDYFQCNACNCLQIVEFPDDILKYYPNNYYSFRSLPIYKTNYIKFIVKLIRNNYLLFKNGLFGKIIYKIFPVEPSIFLNQALLIRQLDLNKKTRILDVGCGAGKLLYNLSISSLRHLLGIDPYIESDIFYSKKLKILKRNIFDIDGQWDLIMFHHSFEHIQNPEETIKYVSKLLSKQGVCLIRIPIVSSFAWEHYRDNWVQLDAPRHFFLHSIESINILAKKANLIISNIIYDSTAFQFWGSEQYSKDIPLKSDNSFGINPSKSIFSKTDIKLFSEKAKILNKLNQGDQAAFFIIKQ